MERQGDRWSFMRPWCVPLRGKLRFEFAIFFQAVAKYAGILVQLPNESTLPTSASLQAIRDALLLFSLVAHGDFFGWKHVLAEHCDFGLDSKQVCESDAFREPHFVFLLDDNKADLGWVGPVLEKLFTKQGEAPTNAPQLAAAVRQIAARGVVRQDGLLSQRVDIPGVLKLKINDWHQGLAQLWESMKRLHASDESWRFPVQLASLMASLDCGFTFGPVSIDLADFDGVQKLVVEDMVTTGSRLMLSAVDFPESFVGFVDGDDMEDACTVGQFIERLLCLSVRVSTRESCSGTNSQVRQL